METLNLLFVWKLYFVPYTALCKISKYVVAQTIVVMQIVVREKMVRGTKCFRMLLELKLLSRSDDLNHFIQTLTLFSRTLICVYTEGKRDARKNIILYDYYLYHIKN